MSRVEVTAAAVADLDSLILTHSLPGSTRLRVRRSLERLEDFPYIGSELTRRWRGLRFVLGPWRWLLVVYQYRADEDRVVVLAIQDARTSTAVIGRG